jgi:hypothetical protein
MPRKNNEEAAMSERSRRLSRRHFLVSIGAGSAATAAAVVVKNSPSAPQVTTDAGKRATRGYQASEHVNNYYRTTTV